MNFSAIFINVALRAAEWGQRKDDHALLFVLTALVFAVMAVEALLNELAYVQLTDRGNGLPEEYLEVERTEQGFDRFQAVLVYFFQRGLADGRNPANDLKALLRLRSNLVHYRFENPPATTLRYLQQRQLVDRNWSGDHVIGWPYFVTPQLALWAYETACHTAREIAEIIEASGEEREAALIRINFDPEAIHELLRAQESDPSQPS